MTKLTDLPNELLFDIFTSLSAQDVISLGQVSYSSINVVLACLTRMIDIKTMFSACHGSRIVGSNLP